MKLASAAVLGHLLLSPFGALTDRVKLDKPWYGFHYEGPVLTLVRAQKVEAPSCEAWTSALVAVPADVFVPAKDLSGDSSAWNAFAPWDKDSMGAVRDCDGFPCDVKLDRPETERMKHSPENDRLKTYYGLIGKRVEDYEKTGLRREYEFPGAPVDPWKWMDSHGFSTTATRPSAISLFTRKLELSPGKSKPLRQVLDRRAAKSPDGEEAAVWVRDAYTDHYFDSWGEWTAVLCDPETRTATVVSALVSEMDFLKKTGIFSRAAYGKFRSAFQEQGEKYLNGQFERLRKGASSAPGGLK